MPKLFNTIIVYDVYVWAENELDARDGALANIRASDVPLKPSEQVAMDVGKRPVRAAWLDEKPLIGPEVSDADYERVRGKTCEGVWKELNVKAEETKTKTNGQPPKTQPAK